MAEPKLSHGIRRAVTASDLRAAVGALIALALGVTLLITSQWADHFGVAVCGVALIVVAVLNAREIGRD